MKVGSKEAQNNCETTAKPLRNHRETTAKPLRNHCETTEKPWFRSGFVVVSQNSSEKPPRETAVKPREKGFSQKN